MTTAALIFHERNVVKEKFLSLKKYQSNLRLSLAIETTNLERKRSFQILPQQYKLAKAPLHLITLSACATAFSGMSDGFCLEVLTFLISSNLISCSKEYDYGFGLLYKS